MSSWIDEQVNFTALGDYTYENLESNSDSVNAAAIAGPIGSFVYICILIGCGCYCKKRLKERDFSDVVEIHPKKIDKEVPKKKKKKQPRKTPKRVEKDDEETN